MPVRGGQGELFLPMQLHLNVFTELREYALTIHCKFSCWMCKFFPAYGSRMEAEGPSAMLIINELVHAATMHTDATVLRVGTSGCGTRESRIAFSSHDERLVTPRETGGVFLCRAVVDDDEPGVEDMREHL